MRKIAILVIFITLLSSATFSVQAAYITITDPENDVSSIDYLTGETIVVTSHPEITVANIDIITATYTQEGKQATVTLQVKGNIEDRGKVIDPDSDDLFETLDTVEYGFQLSTSEEDYMISYSNRTGQIMSGFEKKYLTSSDFSVVGGTLTVWFTLLSENEIYEELTVTSTFTKVNFATFEEEGYVYLSDIAPNPPLEIIEAYAPNIGSVGDTIQFNGSVQPLTGQPPYQYRWDFGDGGTSTLLNPTHVYSKAGKYTYVFTVTDQAGGSTSETGTITITGQSLSAFFTWTPTNPTPGQTITFNASESTPSISIVLYEWDWNNDGVYEESHTTPTTTHSWVIADIYLVTLRVTDTSNMTITKAIPVYIGGEGQTPTTSPNTPGFEIIIMICAIALVIFLRNKRTK